MFDDKLEFDIDELTTAKLKCDELTEALRIERNGLINDLVDLRDSDWQTNAGKQFLKDVNGSWMDQVNQYINLTEMISGLLEKAIIQYGYILYEANNKLTTVIPRDDNV